MTTLGSRQANVRSSFPIFKHLNADFRVFEAPICDPSSRNVGAKYVFLTLEKSGFTTFQALDALAAAVGCKSDDIACAGLKDEDGVTSQVVSLPSSCNLSRLVEFNAAHGNQEESFLRFERVGFSNEPVRTGGLLGNYFQITLRNIQPDHWDRHSLLQRRPYCTFFMINYYDEQRFGVPNGPQTTHLIGGALLNREFKAAFDLLHASKSAEAEFAKRWVLEQGYEAFFESLPQRQLAFYKSAYHSSLWNERLSSALVSESRRNDFSTLPVLSGCVIPKDEGVIANTLSRTPSMEYITYRPDPVTQNRDTISQIRLKASAFAPDEIFEGASKQVIEFFLPTGHYATMLLKQIIARLHEES